MKLTQFFNQYESPVTATIQLLNQLHVKVTNATINETLQNHPDYPSLLSISDALNTWHVENAAVNIENDKLTELPLPFVAFTRGSTAFVLVTAIKDGKVFYLTETNKTTAKELLQFVKEFGGVVLLAKAGENAGEKNYRQSKKAQFKKQSGVLLCLVVVVALLFASMLLFINNNPQHYLLFPLLTILNFAGLLTSIILLWYENDKTNPALQKICTGGPKTNCNAVLNSKAAKIAGLSWSELGFIYFAGLCLLLLLTSFTNNLALLSFIKLFILTAIVYVPFSLFYQWRAIRQWCPLCLTVQAILLLQFVVIAFNVYQPFDLSTYQPFNLLAILMVFILPVIACFAIKPLLQVKQKAKQDVRALQRIKFNIEIFNTLLEKQKHITEQAEGLGIILGNKNAPNTLIKVCNPYCGPCARAHPEIEKLLEENNNLKVQVIFTATNDEHDIRALPVKHLLAIAERNNEVKTKQALHDWYLADKKDYDVFAEKFPMNGELKMQDNKIEKMKDWCDKVEISFTPTIFFNGYQLPDAYSIGDLKYFLAE